MEWRDDHLTPPSEELFPLPSALRDGLIDRALQEDLGSGDLTTESCVDAGVQAEARAVTRGEIVVCGGAVFARVFQRLEPSLQVSLRARDGSVVAADTVIWEVRGDARSILAAERVALNFAQRLSGIATHARRLVSALAEGSATRVTDTRKTTPGLRALERYAVRAGGAYNHRDNLGSAVLIKDNHIAAAGGIEVAVKRARQRAPHTSRIEVEVTTLDELSQALAAGADILLLDNMDTPTIDRAVALAAAAPAKPLLEASGGITIERIAELSAAGVDVISVGALTHSAPAADISLDLSLCQDDG